MWVKPIKTKYSQEIEVFVCSVLIVIVYQHIARASNYAEQMKPVGDPADLHHANMAGNIVKWWKHKILGGYKQFSGKIRLFSILHSYLPIFL